MAPINLQHKNHNSSILRRLRGHSKQGSSKTKAAAMIDDSSSSSNISEGAVSRSYRHQPENSNKKKRSKPGNGSSTFRSENILKGMEEYINVNNASCAGNFYMFVDPLYEYGR